MTTPIQAAIEALTRAQNNIGPSRDRLHPSEYQDWDYYQAAIDALQAAPGPSVALDGLHVSAKARLGLAQAAQPGFDE